MSQFEKDARKVIGHNADITIIRSTKRLDVGMKSTMADERKQALEQWMRQYSDASHFLWIEPEKWNLVTEKSLGNLMKKAVETWADFVIPTRARLADILSQEAENIPNAQWGMNTLPKFQAWTETRANKKLRKDSGEYHDSYFGPVLLKKWAGTDKYLASTHPTRGINVLTPLEGQADWLEVADADVDYSYADVQRTFENGETDASGNHVSPRQGEKVAEEYATKRMKQYMDIVYAWQKAKDVFPTYHKNLIYSQQQFTQMPSEQLKEAYNDLVEILSKLGQEKEDLGNVSLSDSYKTLKERYVSWKSNIHKDIEAFENKLTLKETKRREIWLYSDEAFSKLDTADQELFLNDFREEVQSYYERCQQALSKKDGPVYKAMIVKVGDDEDKLIGYYNNNNDIPNTISLDNAKEAYSTLKKLYIKFNPTDYTTSIDSQMTMGTQVSHPVFEEDSDIQVLEDRLRKRETKDIPSEK